eukprot:5213733-Pyramimonas_sp.AAC.1
MRACARIVERAPSNIGGVFDRGHRADVYHSDTHAGRPAGTVWNDDPRPNEATFLLSQQGGQPTGSQDSRAQ